MDSKKLIICLDGLGYYLLSQKNTPYLYNFGKKNSFARLKTLFAFTGIEYSFFTGKNPLENNIWLEFIYSNKSIFKNCLINIFSFNKKIRDYFGAFLQILKKRTYISGLHNIPKKKVRYFDSCVKEGLWKLKFFQNKDFAFYKWPFFVTKKYGRETKRIILKYESDKERLERLLKSNGKEIYYVQLMKIDKVIHKFGKKSNRVIEALKETDKIIKKCVEKFLDKEKNAEVILWADHGFADIKNYIDLEKKLPKRKDYLYFIAGTTASFWFDNNEAKKEVLKVLGGIKNGRILDKKTAEKYKIPSDKKYGDLIFFVKKKNYFFPNFYQKNPAEKFVAMHGYPDDKELDGFLISTIKFKNKQIELEKALKVLRLI